MYRPPPPQPRVRAADAMHAAQCRRQVCAYRCITSYETKSMEKFSLCVLQKNNCMCNSADIPTLPDPAPQTRFRGEALTHESAQDLFIGWLGKEAFSWKVVSERATMPRLLSGSPGPARSWSKNAPVGSKYGLPFTAAALCRCCRLSVNLFSKERF